MILRKLIFCAGLTALITSRAASAQVAGDPTEKDAVPAKQNVATLKGSVTVSNPFQEIYDFEDVPQRKKFTALKAISERGKSVANFVFDLRGFDWSKEGADAFTEKDLNLKNEMARKYLAQKSHDEKEVKKTALLLQIALYRDRDLNRTVDSVNSLEQLVGRDEAQRLFTELLQLKSGTADACDSHVMLDFEQRRELLGRILDRAAKQDEVLCQVSSRLGKYNHRSKAMRTTAKVVYSSLGIATFTPTLVAPLAEAALLSFMVATGGPEQDKLLKEIYLGKMMESRCHLLNEKAHLIIEGIDMARSTQNKRLLVCTQYLLQQLTNDDEMVTSVFPPSQN